MEELDNTIEPDQALHSTDEHELMLEHVYQEDHELMYLDHYLSDLFRQTEADA